MRDWRWMLLVLALLLGWLQYRFWFGPGNSGEVMMLEAQVANQERDNEGLQQRNDALAAEVKDLKEGQSAIEERARSELGMIKPGEKFYRVVEDAPVHGAACGRRQCAGWRTPGGRAMSAAIWVVVPAAGRGTRFGAPLPKQYLQAGGQILLAHTLDALLAHPAVAGAMVVIGQDDADWPGWNEWAGKPVLTCIGGATRAASVLAGLQALPETVRAMSSCWSTMPRGRTCRWPISAACLKSVVPIRSARSWPHRCATPSSVRRRRWHRWHRAARALWRALTPQLFRRHQLSRALSEAAAAGVEVTDEAMAMERQGQRPLLVEGSEDNFKVTTPADLDRFEFVLSRRAG
jgi:2-C-methyl-D-erythritol 4-phosphate cytidylyltransferase